MNWLPKVGYFGIVDATLKAVSATWALSCATIAFSGGYDMDGDGMSDVWEAYYDAGSLLPFADTDGDGYFNIEESRYGTSPFSAANAHRPGIYPGYPIAGGNSKGNYHTFRWEQRPGLKYYFEAHLVGGDDGDWVTLANYDAVGYGSRFFFVPDSWMPSYDEYRVRVADDWNEDGDLLTNYEEHLYPEMNVSVADTHIQSDGDGIPDFWEIMYGMDRYSSSGSTNDSDGDGYTNLEEYLLGRNPESNDSLTWLSNPDIEGLHNGADILIIDTLGDAHGVELPEGLLID